jgi:UDP-N-acetylglucosamine 2-epimerase
MLKILTVFGISPEIIKTPYVIKETNKRPKDSIWHIDTICRQRKEKKNQRAVIFF